MPLPSLLFLLAATTAQSSPAPPVPTRHWGRMFISPMGEPFRAERGVDALQMWFVQADKNHDGYLTVDEMEADAARFFATLDTNHDGEIDPDEIAHYEQVVAPEVSGGHFMGSMSDAAGGQRQASGRRGGHHHRGGGNGDFDDQQDTEGHLGAARFALLDLPEPVASADADFNRGVSIREFQQAAAQRFAALDLDHQGRLSLAALELIRPAPEPPDHKPDLNAEPDVPPED